MKLRLKKLRRALGLTQCQVAELSGIAVSYCTEIEQGKKQINAKRMEQIAKALRTTPAGLIDSGDTDTDVLQEAAVKLSKLPKGQRDHVYQMIDLFLQTPKGDGNQ